MNLWKVIYSISKCFVCIKVITLDPSSILPLCNLLPFSLNINFASLSFKYSHVNSEKIRLNQIQCLLIDMKMKSKLVTYYSKQL